MEYFKKIQCYKPTKGIIDSPVSIEEVALLQDSINKNILGRIKFINRSQYPIIAIFVHLNAQNIAGEPILVEKERYIYQDMKINSGELYGNKIPLHLPVDTRLLSVKLEKVVFENGTIWDASTGTECEYIAQEEISIPDIIVDEMRKELSTHFPHIEYIHYYYEEGENFWECTCGKVNNISNVTCSFCENGRDAQKKHLEQGNLIPLMTEMAHAKQEKEEEETRKILEEAKIEKEKRLAEMEKEKQKFREIEVKDKKIKLCICGTVIICIIVAIFINLKRNERMKEEAYTQGVIEYKNNKYEKAAEEFFKAGNYNDAKQKYIDSYDKIVEKDKEKLRECLNDYWAVSKADLINVLCYLGKPKEYIKECTDFIYKDGAYTYYTCEYNSSEYPYIELVFENEDQEEPILESVIFYGESSFFDEDSVERILGKEYDTESYDRYTWHNINSASLFTKVDLYRGGYISVDLDDGGYRNCKYELTFYMNDSSY